MWFSSRILLSIINISEKFDKKKRWITSTGTVIIHTVYLINKSV